MTHFLKVIVGKRAPLVFLWLGLSLLATNVFAHEANPWKALLQADLVSLDQTHFSFKANEKKAKVLIFWASWCDYCHEELEGFNHFQKNLPDNVLVLGISLDEEKKSAKEFLDGKGYRYSFFWDNRKKLKTKLNLEKLPTVFVLDQSNKVVSIYTGFSRERFDYILRRIRALNQAGDDS